jgi:hypothetical protein
VYPSALALLSDVALHCFREGGCWAQNTTILTDGRCDVSDSLSGAGRVLSGRRVQPSNATQCISSTRARWASHAAVRCPGSWRRFALWNARCFLRYERPSSPCFLVRTSRCTHTTCPVRCLPTPLKLTAGVLGTVSRRPSGVPWDGDHAVGGLGRDVISDSNGRGVHGVHEWHDGPSRDVRRWRTRDCPWAHRKSSFRPTGIGSSHWLGCLTDGLRHDPSM